ncbi:MAG TPA: ferrous iron transport protein B [Paludibacteraceae bacterium]|nr:ferrous iron transport protein B [Paludibacteraceae bacterium]
MQIKTTVLADLEPGQEAVITKIMGHGSFRRRLTEMGFVKGKKIKVIKKAPLQDPIEYEIMGYKVSLRQSEAELVEVMLMDEAQEWLNNQKFEGTFIDNEEKNIPKEEILKHSLLKKEKVIEVALVGNPNSGKTTLFNYASGAHERVGNYAGVTVDSKEAILKKNGYVFKIVDLPGTYSINEYTPEELFVRNHLTEKMPDVVINVVDASNLERNLFLTTQLIDMDIKVVMALNMFDELEKKGIHFDYRAFGKMLGIPVVPTIASKGKGIDELFKKVIEVYEDADPISRHIHINYGTDIEKAIKEIQDVIWKEPTITDKFSSRYLAIKLLEGDKTTMSQLEKYNNYKEVIKTAEKVRQELEKEYGETAETIITEAKYGFIDGALKETLKLPKKNRRETTHELDDLLTHKIWGYPIFLFFMWLMFEATFKLGNYPMEWIDNGVTLLGNWIENVMPEGALRDLIVQGIIGGVGGVIIFLPNIMILFFFISIMEDTGYMARASFIMDKLMHKIGLHGKSFVPLVMGFGCNVPAIMATRTLKNRKDRILTMIIIPFMSCSARLPVYLLLISAIFYKHQGLILFSLYLIGIMVAVITALLVKKIAFKKEEAPFVMELPPYRIPTLKNTTLHMWNKSKEYLKKIGNVILLVSIIIWALGYFPHNKSISEHYDTQIAKVQQLPLDKEEKETKILTLEVAKESALQEQSYLGQLGHFIQPAMYPLGFDWKMGVSLLAGLSAKEVVVSTMGILYQAERGADENSASLQEKIQQQVHTSGPLIGQKVFTPITAFAFMIFILIYFPCIAVISAIKKEGGWQWAVFSVVYNTSFAWLAAFAVYQIGILIV